MDRGVWGSGGAVWGIIEFGSFFKLLCELLWDGGGGGCDSGKYQDEEEEEEKRWRFEEYHCV